VNRELAICPKVDPTRPPSTAPPTPKPVKTTSKLAPSEAAAPSVAAETAHDDEEKEEEEEEEEEGLSQSTGYFYRVRQTNTSAYYRPIGRYRRSKHRKSTIYYT